MKKIRLFYGFIIILFTNCTSVFAQVLQDAILEKDSATVIISSIKITGNKHTKEYIILRETPFNVGDTLLKTELTSLLKKAKIQIYNTNLFIEVDVDSLLLQDALLQVNIKVIERWYIYPKPRVDIVDGINVWVKTFNADLQRVVYGIDFKHQNFSGRRDVFGVTLLNGFSRAIAINYFSPYSNSKLTEGFGIGASYFQNRSLTYETDSLNKPKVRRIQKDNFVRTSFGISGSYSRRINFFKRINYSLSGQYVLVDDSTIIKNKRYFNNPNTKQFFPSIAVSVTYANTDKNLYPLKGLTYNYGISKTGIGLSGGINNTTAFGYIAKYFAHNHHFYSSIKTAGVLKLPFEQAYVNQRAIGTGNLKLRGLDLYLVDGVAAAVANYTFSKKIISFRIPFPFGIKQIPYIPVNIFAKTYADIGYSHIPKPFFGVLNNRFLYTEGFGIDILTFYDSVIKLEYSFNQLGEKGVFLQITGGF
jgi:outer membrane protein assembly factor BamA